MAQGQGRESEVELRGVSGTARRSGGVVEASALSLNCGDVPRMGRTIVKDVKPTKFLHLLVTFDDGLTGEVILKEGHLRGVFAASRTASSSTG